LKMYFFVVQIPLKNRPDQVENVKLSIQPHSPFFPARAPLGGGGGPLAPDAPSPRPWLGASVRKFDGTCINVITLFFSSSLTKRRNKLERCIMFEIKIGACASGELSGLPHKAGSWLYPQTLTRLENLASKHERDCNLRANDWERTGQ
jgi:hypothetical protein